MEQNKDQGGAAVRGEAVALNDADIVEIARVAHADGRLSWIGFDKDDTGEHTVPILSKCHFQLVRAVLAKVSARAADAPSEPSELQIQKMLMALLQCAASELSDYAPSLMEAYERDVRNVYGAIVKSRAADALGSQPTDQETRDRIRNAIVTCGHAIEDKSVKLFRDPKFPGGALSQLIDRILLAISGFSSQPTDGGVRNG